MEQQARNAVGRNIRRIRTAKELSQQRLAVECARLGYDLTRATLAKIEAGIRAVSDIELFVIAHALNLSLADLYPPGLLNTIRDGKVAPFHVRQKSRRKRRTVKEDENADTI
jgi:transcriptional regulator with XRE-family HTH domain